MRPRSRVSLPTLLLLALAVDAGAQCTTADEARDVQRSARARVRCNDRILRSGPAETCAPIPPAPACAGTLVDDALALAYGANNPAAAAVDLQTMRDQYVCQQRIGKAVARFIGRKLSLLIRGESRVEAERRARRTLDRLPQKCAVSVATDAGGVVLPDVGPGCQTVVGASGTPVAPESLRDCLIALLEARLDAVAPGGFSPPNLIIILTDDQRWDTVDATHQTPTRPGPVMPNVTAELVDQGLTFSNGFVTRALCCPSRASILKGQYAHTTGIFRNMPPNGGAQDFDDAQTIATWLDAAGYRTGIFGKYLNGYAALWDQGTEPPYVPPGWDEWHVFEAPRYYDYFLIEDGATQTQERNQFSSGCAGTTDCLDECTNKTNYSTDVLAAKVVEFIEDSAGSPFFVYFAPYAPHGPSCPAERHLGLFDDAPLWRPPNYDEGGDESDKPLWVQNRCPMGQNLKDNIDEDRRLMLGSLQAVDEAVAAIMDTLRTEGIDDDTLVLFTADNGFAWGEHCRRAKSCAYEECARVPMIVRYPPLIPLPAVETRFGLNIDFALTFGELAGLFPPIPPDGRSLKRVLSGDETVWRDDFLIEHWDNDDNPDSGIPTLACLREDGLKYVEYETTESELYDLVADPYELDNRTNDPGYATTKARMAERLRELRPDWP